MKTHYNGWKRTLAVLLVLILVVQIMPANVLATGLQAGRVIGDDSISEGGSYDIEEQSPEKTILAEDTDKRGENVKHFLNTDGTYTAIKYSRPVHYKETAEADWIDINNTLSLSKEAATNKDIYTPASSPLDVRFGKIYGGNNVVFTSGEHVLSWSYETPTATVDPPVVEVQRQQGATDNAAASAKASASGAVIDAEEQAAGNITAQKLERFDISADARDDNARFTELDKVTDGIVYNGIYPDVDLEYILDSIYLKENIVLNSNTARSEFVINYNTGSLTAEQINEKEISLKTSDGEDVFTISAPYMTDSAGAMSGDVALSIISQSEGTIKVKLSAGKEWLAAEGRAYPVKIDPYVMEAVRSFDQDATAIYKSASYPYGALVVGNDNGTTYGKTKIYVKFTLPTLAAGDMITGAYLKLAQLDGTYGYQHVGNSSLKINAYKVTESWSESTVRNSTSYSGLPKNDGTIIDYQDVGSRAEPGWVTFNISKVVKGWYDGEANYGICLRANNENIWALAKFVASNNPSYIGARPTLQINYRNSKGLEPYWTAHSHSAGESGTGYVNDYNGNLVFAAPIASTTGSKMPVSLSLVYNGYQAGSNINLPNAVGLGWRLNVQAKILIISPTSNADDLNTKLYNAGYRFLYDDADGTTHYFKESSAGVYKDEDGLGLTITQVTEEKPSYEKYKITSDDGTSLIFTSRGCLRKAFDTNGNYYEVKYKESSTEDWKISKVIDGAGRVFTFTSNSSGQITKISDPAGRNVSFTYSGNLLTKITYADGTYTEFKYSGNYLSAVHSRNGGWIRYSYPTTGDSAAKSRISKVEEYSSADTGTFSSANLGKSLQLSFDKLGRTKFTDNRGRTETYIFDNYGRTVNIFDAGGGTSVYKYESGNTTGKKANTLLSNTIGKKFVDNLFLNHSFENGLTNWTYSGALVSESEHYLGFKSIRLSSGGYIRQRLDKSSGSFNVSAYVKGSSANSKARLVIYFYDSSDNCISTFNSRIFELGTEWQRIYYPNTVVNGASYMIARVSNTGTDNIWVDCVQAEGTYSVNEYNLVENGGMENTSSNAWIKYKCTDADGYSTGSSERYIKIIGDCVTKKKMYQTVQINQPAKDLHLTLSAAAYATSVPLSSSERKFCLGVTTYFTDNTTVYDYFDFNADCAGVWQYNAGTVGYSGANANKTVKYVNICLYYDLNANTAYFDDVQLTIDKTGQAYTYDSEGNLISAKDNAGRSETYTYSNAHELTKLTTTDNKEYEFVYPTVNNSNKHQLISATSKSSGIKYSYTYDSTGNVTSVTSASTDSGYTKYIERYTNYTQDGNYPLNSSDDRGCVTHYTYDTNKGTLKNVKDSNGEYTYYTYNPNNDRLLSVSDSSNAGASGASTVSYSYTNKGLLSSVSSPTTTYNFEYDAFGNNTKVKIGNRTLTTNTYAANNGTLLRSDYGNGDYVEYTYDKLDRVKNKSYNGIDVGCWSYNANGQVGYFEDPVADREYYYYYDDIGRPLCIVIRDMADPTGFYAELERSYNNLDQTTGVSYTFAGQTKNVNYAYSSRDYWPLETTFNGSNKITNSYDALGRLTGKTYTTTNTGAANVEASFGYCEYVSDNIFEIDRTTATVESVSFSSAAGGLELNGGHYTYDDNGNITCERAGASNGAIREKYSYDSKNQLVRHDSATQNKSFTYGYDAAGNILSRKEYAYTTGTLGTATATVSYTYGDSSWGDLLTAYNGQNIRYDTIGNPTTYLGWTLGWTGRSLMSAVKGSQTLSYTYTPDGIRSSKTVNGTKTEYLLNGTQILAQKTGSDVMWFFYDSTGARVGVQQGSITAYYLYNLQGDVVALADAATGKIIATYEYDAWGKCTVTNAIGYSIGTANPFRYRGYYYDTETGFYYLNSRYYNPEVGRFLNADSFASTNIAGELSTNMFAYCENNPVNMVDTNGCDPTPSWAKRIVNGNATEADYKKALSVNPDSWGGFARYTVDEAVEIAREYYNSRGVEVEQVSSVFGVPIAILWSAGIATDKYGHKALVITIGGGGGAGISVFEYNKLGLGGGAIEYEKAKMVWDIAGAGTSSGATVGPFSYGITGCDATKDMVHGWSLGFGLEIHATRTYTWIIPLNY